MRSKSLFCAAIAAVGVSGWFAPVARADSKDAKKKAAAVPAAELHADDKSMKKQSQWEDKVMGPDSKRGELDKIARARAINEKAEKEREKQAALEAAAPAPKAAPTSASGRTKSEVSLIAPEKDEPSRTREISPQLETAAAQKPVAPAKPADDKFIDKLLHEEDAPSKKRASSANDKELESLLAGAKDKPRKKGDSVDDVLKMADKGPAMPAPRAQSGGLPDWAKTPEIAPTPAAAPPPPPVAAAKPATKSKDSGVIQVVQGAAGNAPAVVTSSRPAAPPVATRAGRKTAAAKPAVGWSDPFADKRPVAAAPQKEAASRASASTDSTWNDPFAEPNEGRKAVRHTTPTATPTPAAAPKRNEKAEPGARPAGWKDPFTKAPSEPARTPVAMREVSRNESAKWEIASRRPAAARAAADSRSANGGWGVLKKRAR
jgi:hypothetical protein